MGLACDNSGVAIFEVTKTRFNYDYCNQVHGANAITFIIMNNVCLNLDYDYCNQVHHPNVIKFLINNE